MIKVFVILLLLCGVCCAEERFEVYKESILGGLFGGGINLVVIKDKTNNKLFYFIQEFKPSEGFIIKPIGEGNEIYKHYINDNFIGDARIYNKLEGKDESKKHPSGSLLPHCFGGCPE